ncbi:uncharacterized protein LOC144103769 [Amblyomma americanum]
MTEQWPAYAPYQTESLKTFFNNKRRTYRLEKKKMLETKSGQAADEAYTGKWRFFRTLRFLDAVRMPTHRSINGQCEGNAASAEVSPEQDTNEAVGRTAAESGLLETQSAPSPPSPGQQPGKKRRRTNERAQESSARWSDRQQILEKLASAFEVHVQPEDPADQFGKLVAAHIKSVPREKVLSCQAEILKVIERFSSDMS